MKTIILAAGEGTRMAPWTTLLPKALLPIAGKPVVRRIVEKLMTEGFDDILIRVDERFIYHFNHEFRDLPNVKFSVSGAPSGTAGEIFKIRPDETFLLYYGDELTDLSLDHLVQCHNRRRPLVTLGLVDSVRLEVGVVTVDEWLFATDFNEKPPIEKNTWAGIAILEPDVLNFINPGDDFARDVFPRLLRLGKKIFCYVEEGTEWLDTGTLSHFRRAEKKMREKTNA